MALTAEQLSRVEYLLHGDWGRPDSADSDKAPEFWTDFDHALSQVESSEELHEFVDRWNWDGGAEPVRRALAHPLCDRGTALMIYWRLEPIFYLKPNNDTREKVEANLWPEAIFHWDMLRELERRLTVNDFRSAMMAFDPAHDRGRDRTKQRLINTPSIPLFENINNKLVKVAEMLRTEETAINVRESLPAVVFLSVSAGDSAGT